MKLPPPRTDMDLVKAIEDHLDQQEMTRIVHTNQSCPGLVTTIPAGRPPLGWHRPMFQILAEKPEPTTTWDTGCAACFDLSRSWNCAEHQDEPKGLEIISQAYEAITARRPAGSVSVTYQTETGEMRFRMEARRP